MIDMHQYFLKAFIYHQIQVCIFLYINQCLSVQILLHHVKQTGNNSRFLFHLRFKVDRYPYYHNAQY